MTREIFRGWTLDSQGHTQLFYRAYSSAVPVDEDGKPLKDFKESLKVDFEMQRAAEPILSEQFDVACEILSAKRAECVLVMHGGNRYVMQESDLRPAYDNQGDDVDFLDRNVA